MDWDGAPSEWWRTAKFTLTNTSTAVLEDPLIEFTVQARQTVSDNGAWRVPASWHGIDSGWVGFHEYYLDVPSCDALPYTRVTYGAPYSTVHGITAALSRPRESPMSRCTRQAAVRWEANDDGSVMVESGYKRDTLPAPPTRGVVDVSVDVVVGPKRVSATR